MISTSLDLGAAAIESGRCPVCSLTDRPLWRSGGAVFCAACATRRYPDVTLTFHSGVADTDRLSAFAAHRGARGDESAMKIASIVVWDAGMYDAKILRCESSESTYQGKEGQPRFKWTLRLKSHDGEEYNDIPYYTNVTLSTHVQAKLRPFVKAVMPELDLTDPEVAKNLDTDDLVGKRCRVLLGINEEKGQNTVDKVLAPETAKSKAVAMARPAPEPEEEEPAPAQRQPVGAGARKQLTDDSDSVPF